MKMALLKVYCTADHWAVLMAVTKADLMEYLKVVYLAGLWVAMMACLKAGRLADCSADRMAVLTAA